MSSPTSRYLVSTIPRSMASVSMLQISTVTEAYRYGWMERFMQAALDLLFSFREEPSGS